MPRTPWRSGRARSGSVWGYRRELKGVDPRVYALIVPSVVGGAAGAVLLHLTPPGIFDVIVPVLVGFATFLFMIQEPLQRRFNWTVAHAAGSHWLSWTMFYQLLVGLYGGYFGAGIGILMLAALGLMGHTDIHQMNGLKNLLATCINAVAAIYFMVRGTRVLGRRHRHGDRHDHRRCRRRHARATHGPGCGSPRRRRDWLHARAVADAATVNRSTQGRRKGEGEASADPARCPRIVGQVRM